MQKNSRRHSKVSNVMNKLDVQIKLTDSSNPIPKYMHEGDAALDLQSTVDVRIAPFERALVPCGFAMSIPEGFAALVLPRSGLAAKSGLTVINSPGLIDSGYRGEIAVALINLNPNDEYVIHEGDRIAQMMLIEVPHINLVAVDSLDETQRNIGGFGSSGIH